MHDELKRVPGDIACLYNARGRIFVIKNGALLPQVLGNAKAFEKLMAPGKNPFGKAVGHAVTPSGDHPSRWRVAKSLLRPIVGSEALQVETSEAIAKALNEKLLNLHGQPEVNLYMEVIKASIETNFQLFFGSDIKVFLEGQMDLDEFVRESEILANTLVIAKQECHAIYAASQKVSEEALRASPKGTFGYDLQALADDSNQPEFTQVMAQYNALFYLFALSIMTSIVLHWISILLIRHPGHLDRIHGGLAQGNNTHLLMCLKETMRLYPPVSMLMPRRSKIDTQLAGVNIPAKSLVLSMPMLLIQDQEFRPNRWEHNPNPVDAVYEQANYYAPFSGGTRACLAPRFFTTLLETTMSTVLMNHDIALAEPDPWVGQPIALQHFPDANIGFKPAKDLKFTVSKARQDFA